MASGTVVYTGTVGPGKSLTAISLTNVSNVNFDFANGVVAVTYLQGNTPVTQQFDYSAIATFTATISGGVTTVTLS